MAVLAQFEVIEGEIEELQATLVELTQTTVEKTAAMEDARKAGAKSGKALDKVLKEIAACVSDRSHVY